MTIKLKIELRRLFSKENADLDWDEKVPDSNKEAWVRLIAELLNMEAVVISRTLRPLDTGGNSELYLFFNGSLDTYATCAYARWNSNSESPTYTVRLVAAKARVTSRRGETTPISELCSLLIASRFALTLVESLSQKPVSIT